MSHLGRWLTALIDGELAPDERDHVLNHLAGCQGCLDEANAMRALKRRLTALGQAAAADAAIETRLIHLASPDRTLAGDQERSRPGARLLPPAPRRARPRGIPEGWKVAAGSAGSALVAIGFAAFLLGNTSGSPPAPRVTPSVDSYLLQHAYDAGQAPAPPASGNSFLPGGAVAVGGQPVPGGAAPGSPGYPDPAVPALVPGLAASPGPSGQQPGTHTARRHAR